MLQTLLPLTTLNALKTIRLLEDPLKRIKYITEYHNYQSNIWIKDPRYKFTIASYLVDIHLTLRATVDDVVKSSKHNHVKIEHFKSVNLGLREHHNIEDNIWFPKLIKLHPDFKIEIENLEKDHNYLISLEEKILNNDYDALVKFNTVLNDHINREELIAIPFLMEGTGGMQM